MTDEPIEVDAADTRVYGVMCPDRDSLVVYADGFMRGLRLPLNEKPYLRIVLPCGNVREYLSKENVPERSVLCHCGEIPEDHWFVLYEDDEARHPSEGGDAL